MADRDLAMLNLGYTEIRAPIDGVVGNRTVRAGAYATVGAQLLAIVPAHGLWVDANFKESQLAAMREGQPAEVVADVLPGVSFRGRVASLAPATGAQFSVIPPENATGNFTKIVQRVPVRIRLEDDASDIGKLRPGLSVVVRVDGRPNIGGTGQCGATVFRHACKLGSEGIVSKRLTALYRSGPSRDWLKVRTRIAQRCGGRVRDGGSPAQFGQYCAMGVRTRGLAFAIPSSWRGSGLPP
jgi:hypothetical protein